MKITLCALIMLIAAPTFAQDWSAQATLPGEEICLDFDQHHVCLRNGNRANIYQLPTDQWKKAIYQGSQHALSYPVEATGLKIPFAPIRNYFEGQSNSWIRRAIYKLTKLVSPFNSLKEFYAWMGLHPYPVQIAEEGPNVIADMGWLEHHSMGVTIGNENQTQYMTFGCASCHSAELFGTKVLGMTNRFPKANETFIYGKQVLDLVSAPVFKMSTGATKEETAIYAEARKEIQYVGLKKPLTLGLDTSLAQVALSLSRRADDEYASKDPRWLRHPRSNALEKDPADSKPAVWWNLKYKTKWLSDGSIISGNPIYTNFLWNEIGRGVDLKQLEKWLVNNQQVIRDLTAFVFSTQSPRYEDFFPGAIDIELAKLGQQLFNNNCTRCHGMYEKGWEANALDFKSQVATTNVWYHKSTKIVNVGTDNWRAKGITHFADDLNRLKISKTIGTVVEAQNGYIPPPLVGIWARWPYFHNNSVPTLYDVLTPDHQRPSSYIAVPSEYASQDFDPVKNGYPAPEKIRAPYRHDKAYFFNTKIKGMSNKGHTAGILLDDAGREKFTHQDKLALIEFLKTL